MFVHPGFEADLTVFIESVGSHRKDGGSPIERIGANGPGCLHAVEHRHLHVHQDQGVAVLAGQIQRQLAVVGNIDNQAHFFQHAARHFLGDRFILGQQDARTCMISQQTPGSVNQRGAPGWLGSEGFAKFERDDEPEGTTIARHTINTDRSAHQGHQTLADDQPQAGTTVLAGHAVVGLFEGPKQTGLRFAIDTDAGIADLEAHLHHSARLSEQAGAQGHRTLVGEFDGIANQVEQDLAKAKRVTLQRQTDKLGWNIGIKPQPLLARLVAKYAANMFNGIGQLQGFVLQDHAFGLDLGDVEDVVEDAQQVVGSNFGLVELILPLGIVHAPPGEVDHAQNAVHRRPEFVAHVGQESTLGPAGCLSGILGCGQFGGTGGDERFQLFTLEFFLLAQQGLVGLALGNIAHHRHHLDAATGRGDEAGMYLHGTFASVLAGNGPFFSLNMLTQPHPLHALAGALLHFRIEIDGLIPAQAVHLLDAVAGQHGHRGVPEREMDVRWSIDAMADRDTVDLCFDDGGGKGRLLLRHVLCMHPAGQFLHQAQGIGGQCGVDRQDDVDQGARVAAHPLPGLLPGSVQRQSGAQRHDGIGHGTIGFKDVRGQPVHEKTQGFFGNATLRRIAQCSTQARHFVDKTGMGSTMQGFCRIISEVFAPEPFLCVEVVNGIGRQFVEHHGESGWIAAKGDMTGQCIEQLHQLAVLFVDIGQAGVEILVPGENIDALVVTTQFHRAFLVDSMACIRRKIH